MHERASYAALAAGAVLVAMASTSRAAFAAGIYSLSLVAMFAVSAIYHRPTWAPAIRQRLRRLDHATIFVLIAGSYTPFCMLALDGGVGGRLLVMAWVGAAVGILQAVFWVGAPRILTAGLYVALGWLVVPYLPQMWAALGGLGLTFLACCGLLFTLGAVVYALRRPDPLPHVFGYHEIFHSLVTVACAFEFAAVALLVKSAGMH